MYDTLTVANIAHYWLPLLLTITNTTHLLSFTFITRY